MATSGTVAATVIDVAGLVEHAVRRTGVAASTLTGEQLQSARENMFMLLTDMVNRGISLWCVVETLVPMTANFSMYTLPAGTADVLEAFYGTATYPTVTAPISTATTVGAQLAAATLVETVTATFTAAGTCTPVLEYSSNGSVWTTAQTLAPYTATAAGERCAWRVRNTASVAYWRVRETVLASTPLSGAVFGTLLQTLPMADFNRTEYYNQPNKLSNPGRPLQYRFEKTMTPSVLLWPPPSDATGFTLLVTHRQPQDVGDLTNTLEIPQRWYQAITFQVGYLIALELPPDQLPPGRLDLLQKEGERYLSRAEDGETDGARIRFTPKVAGYTK